MPNSFSYNPRNQLNQDLISLEDIPMANTTTDGLMRIKQYASLTATNVTYDAPAIDDMIATATGGGITAVNKEAGSSAAFTVTRAGTTVTLGIKDASVTQVGLVQLNNTLTSTATTLALTAAQGKVLKDAVDTKISGIGVNGQAAGTVTNLTFSGVDGVTVGVGTPAASTAISISLDVPAAKTALGLGTAAYKDTGTAAGQIPVLDSNGKLIDTILPAIAIVDTFVCPTAANDAAITAYLNGLSGTPVPEKGDIIIVRAGAKTGTYIILTTKAVGSYTNADWTNLEIPAGLVSSITFAGTTYTPTNGVVTITNVPWSALTGVPTASTSVAGIVQLNDTTSSTSTTQAASANSVRAAFAQANTKVAATLATTAAAVTSVKIGDAALAYANKANTDLAVTGYVDNKATDTLTTANEYTDTQIAAKVALAVFDVEFTKAQLTTGNGTVTSTVAANTRVIGVSIVNGADNSVITLSGFYSKVVGTTLTVTIFDAGDPVATIYGGALANAASKMIVHCNN